MMDSPSLEGTTSSSPGCTILTHVGAYSAMPPIKNLQHLDNLSLQVWSLLETKQEQKNGISSSTGPKTFYSANGATDPQK